jgi:hypothetical protein
MLSLAQALTLFPATEKVSSFVRALFPFFAGATG